MLVEKYGWAIQKKLLCIDESRFYIFSHPQEFKNILVCISFMIELCQYFSTLGFGLALEMLLVIVNISTGIQFYREQ